MPMYTIRTHAPDRSLGTIVNEVEYPTASSAIADAKRALAATARERIWHLTHAGFLTEVSGSHGRGFYRASLTCASELASPADVEPAA